MPIEKTVAELARLLDAQAEGDRHRQISGVAPLESAHETDLSFVESKRNVEQALASKAGCILVPNGLELPGKHVLAVRNPRSAMARAIEIFHPTQRHKPGVHPTAQIGEGVLMGKDVSVGAYAVIADRCQIGAGTRVGEGCVLGEGSSIGEDCLLHARVTLYARTQVGARVILHSGVVLGSDGFGYARESGRYHKFPQIGTVE